MLRFLLLVLFMVLLFAFACNITQGNDNIVVLLDTSGSMYDTLKNGSGDKITAAKKALIETVSQIPLKTNLGILTFNDWLVKLGTIDQKSTIDKINDITVTGSTPLGEFMKFGADALLEERIKEKGVGTYRFLIITDGEANDTHLVERYLPDILSRGIIVDVIGVDMASSHSLANKVHSYKDVNDASSLKKAINSVLAEVSSNQDSLDDFELMEGIPDKNTTSKIIELLSYLPNDPIGEKKQYGSTTVLAEEPSSNCWLIIVVTMVFIVTLILVVMIINSCS